jgi:hypothetical protein
MFWWKEEEGIRVRQSGFRWKRGEGDERWSAMRLSYSKTMTAVLTVVKAEEMNGGDGRKEGGKEENAPSLPSRNSALLSSRLLPLAARR